MPMEGMLKLVEELKERAVEHGEALRKNESLTRYALIDPLLRELGWNMGDPSQVTPEYRSERGAADYALGGKPPKMIVEAKKLGVPLDSILAQVVNYCTLDGIPHFAVTDGAKWGVYALQAGVPIDQQMVVSWDLLTDCAETVCLKALALWKPSVTVGAISAGERRVIKEESESNAVSQPKPIPTPERFTPLTEITDVRFQQPDALRFPDGTVVETSRWNAFTVETARWLINQGAIHAGNLPLRAGPRSRRCVVNASPVHPDGNPFRSSREVGAYFVETNAGAAQHVANAVLAITQVGQNPAKFGLRLKAETPSSIH